MISATTICCLLLTGAQAMAQGRRILIIESYHPVLEWTSLCEQGIRETLGKQYDIHTFYMDTKRIPETEFGSRADAAWDTYQKLQPELVMLGDDNALRLLGRRFAQSKTPVVFFGINNNPRNYFDTLPPNITGVLERTPLIPWLRYLRDIFPQARKALILMDSSMTSDSIINVTFQKRTEISISGMLVEYRIIPGWNEWMTAVTRQKGFDMIIMPTFHNVRMENGDSVDIHTLIEWTSANSSVPVFTNQDYTVSSRGAAGAYTLNAKAHGAQAAEMVSAILGEGVAPSTMIFQKDNEGLFIFNQQQLKRFGISLPPQIMEKASWQ